MPKPSPEMAKLFRECRAANKHGAQAAIKCKGNPYGDRGKNPHPVGTLVRSAWYAGYDAEALKKASAIAAERRLDPGAERNAAVHPIMRGIVNFIAPPKDP